MAAKLKRGMNVIVIAGREKHKSGKILHIDRDKNRVIVEGVNMIKRATKPNQKNQQGGMVEREAALHISNVAAVDPDSKGESRVGFEGTGKQKVRIARASGKAIQ